MPLQLLPPLTTLRQFDTCRLLPSRFAETEDSVLAPLADNDQDLRDLFELDNATNARLRAQHGGAAGITTDELVFGVPHFRIINAAYTYPRPEGSRFNSGQRGAWYCAFDSATALAEVSFHKAVEYAEIGRYHDSVQYQTMLADFTASFYDLRANQPFAACLQPDSYIASQTLAEHLLDSGALGVIYPSVRHAGGTNLACFRPALVGNVRKGASYRLTWQGSPVPTIETL
ncbi:MAG: RES family NAD+ phosphorylase [Burkholderiaceae bacterium]|nr:RES family NAD+ phosphorylase [Burkholderiaceae bacterium]